MSDRFKQVARRYQNAERKAKPSIKRTHARTSYGGATVWNTLALLLFAIVSAWPANGNIGLEVYGAVGVVVAHF